VNDTHFRSALEGKGDVLTAPFAWFDMTLSSGGKLNALLA
jgi:hypothetical protein